jgi:hypothetical protein
MSGNSYLINRFSQSRRISVRDSDKSFKELSLKLLDALLFESEE